MTQHSRKSIFEHIKSQPQVVIDKIYSGAIGSNPNAASASRESSYNILGGGDSKETTVTWAAAPQTSDQVIDTEKIQRLALIQSQYACKAIFQSLPLLAKCLIMKLLFVQCSFTLRDLTSWLSSESMDLHVVIIEELISLRILVPHAVTQSKEDDMETHYVVSHNYDGSSDSDAWDLTKAYAMNSYFQNSLRIALVHPVEPWSYFDSASSVAAAVEGKKGTRGPTRRDLDRLSASRWNEVLGYIVNLTPMHLFPTNILKVFVQRAKIMKQTIVDGKEGMVMTAQGYEYMLKDYLSQVWDFVYTSIRYSRSQEQALSLLFMLSYCSPGRGYLMEALTPAQRQLVFEFSQVGIIYLEAVTATHFYPTKVAVNMLFGAMDLLQGGAAIPSSSNNSLSLSIRNDDDDEDYSSDLALKVIVETNNQVVAYLSSDIHLAMLQLFVDIHIRMPNMVIGKITKEKAREAFRLGIAAYQIIDFLMLHAHPILKSRVPIVPENITDQFAIWEAENQRIEANDAVVVDFRDVDDFAQSAYRSLVDNLQHARVLLWEGGEGQRMVAVTTEGFKMVQSAVDQLRGYG